MKFQRLTLPNLEEHIGKGKAIILYGARQVGKTTLIKHLVERLNLSSFYLNCDNPDTRSQLENKNQQELKNLIGNNELIIIDEAQRVQNIGLTIKILVDNFPQQQIIASGSSSLDLANSINEPLTGRKFSFSLYPISFNEYFSSQVNSLDISRGLNSLLQFGSYPEILTQTNIEDKERNIRELAGDALFKDIYTFQKIKNPSVLRTLLQALAFQIGSEVSYNELAQTVGIDKKTIESYVDLLEKNFIIFRLSAFSRNLRNELKKSKKIYFVDLGIRNVLINNFQDLTSRNDVGSLWENFCVVERIKLQAYSNLYSNNYFWRTYDGAEIDFVEERNGNLFGYEFKWNKNKKTKEPSSWRTGYPEATWKNITPESIKEFLNES